MKTIPDTFAWGVPAANGCQCPALYAGYDVDSDWDTRCVAELYDSIASHFSIGDEQYPDEGTIDAADARRAWLDTIERFAERLEEGYDDMDRLHLAARIYRDIWGDDL